SEEHTSELQSLTNLVCRLLLEKKKKKPTTYRGRACRKNHEGHGRGPRTTNKANERATVETTCERGKTALRQIPRSTRAVRCQLAPASSVAMTASPIRRCSHDSRRHHSSAYPPPCALSSLSVLHLPCTRRCRSHSSCLVFFFFLKTPPPPDSPLFPHPPPFPI